MKPPKRIVVLSSAEYGLAFLECLRFVPIDAFCFQNGEEILCHCIVIRITFP